MGKRMNIDAREWTALAVKSLGLASAELAQGLAGPSDFLLKHRVDTAARAGDIPGVKQLVEGAAA